MGIEVAIAIALGFAASNWLVWRVVSRHQRALRRSEQRLRALLGSSSQVVLITNAAGEVVYQSPAAASTWGYTGDALVGRSVLDLVESDDVNPFHQLLSRTVGTDGAREAAEFSLRLADDSGRDHELIALNLLHDPAIAGVVLTCRDVTERSPHRS